MTTIGPVGKKELLGVAVLLLCHFLTVLSLIPRWSATLNEPGHIVGGLSCWYQADYSLYRVNPPLPRMVASSVLLFTPGICLDALLLSQRRDRPRQEYRIGQIFSRMNSNSFHEIVCSARLAGLFWVTLGGLVLWSWAREIGGPFSGLTSLALWVLEPSVTAHSVLATADIPGAVLCALSSYLFYRFMQSGGSLKAAATGIALGSAILCKFTALLLIPAWALALTLTAWQTPTTSVGRLDRRVTILHIGSALFIAWGVVLIGYGFQGLFFPISGLEFRSHFFSNNQKWLNALGLGSVRLPVPKDFLEGIDMQKIDFEGGMTSYLRGSLSHTGWWYYYLYAFCVKSPEGHISIYLLAAIITTVYCVKHNAALWAFPFLVVATASAQYGYTDHLRYILPAYPFLMVMAGFVVGIARDKHPIIGPCIFPLLLMWSCLSVWYTYPDYLSYFNRSSGGVQQGWFHLSSSNVDWGQDWIRLGNWLDQHPDNEPVYLALTGHIDSRLYLGRHFKLPHRNMRGYAVVDARSLVFEHPWLWEHKLVAQIGGSVFIFKVDT